jgi:hypothetical protein
MRGPSKYPSRNTTRRTAAFALVLFAAAAGIAAPAGAQIRSYDDYRIQLGKYGERASALMDSIADVDVRPTYCTDADRRAAGKRLAELVAEVGDLGRDWVQFKQTVERYGRTTQGIGHFGPENANPNDPNFWSAPDREVVQHVRADLEAKRAEFRKSAVIDCNAPKTAARPPAPPQPPPPKPDPLAGLTRPKLLVQSMPAAPAPFCSEEARWAWIKSVIRPLMDANINASSALREYGDEVWDRLQAATKPGKQADPDVVRILDKELKWAHDEHVKLDKVYFDQIVKLRESATVIDCSEHFTTPQPVPAAKPDTNFPRTRERPGTGTPPDTTFPRTRERPGTGAPLPTDTLQPKATPAGSQPKNQPAPQTGALPGGKLRVGGWSIGAGIEENWYQGFAHTAGDQQNIDTFDGKQTTPGWGVELGYRRAAWRVDVCRHVNRLHYTQFFTTDSPFSRIEGDLDGSFYDFQVGRGVDLRWNTYVEVFGGVTFAYDKLEFTAVSPSGIRLPEESRSLDTWKSNVGVAVEHAISPDFNWRLGMTYTGAGKTDDADANLRLSAGVTYKLPVKFGF